MWESVNPNLIEVFLLFFDFRNVEEQTPHFPSELQRDALIDPPDQLKEKTHTHREEVLRAGFKDGSPLRHLWRSLFGGKHQQLVAAARQKLCFIKGFKLRKKPEDEKRETDSKVEGNSAAAQKDSRWISGCDIKPQQQNHSLKSRD